MNTVLAIGATTMLADAIRELLRRGYTVISVARNPERIAIPAECSFRYKPIASDWKDPTSMADAIATALHDYAMTRVDAALLWIHSAYRPAALKHIEPLINPDGMMLQIWGTTGISDNERTRNRDCLSRHVILGSVAEIYETRWLSHEEISRATIYAWDYPKSSTTPGSTMRISLIEDSLSTQVFQAGER